MSLVPKCYDVRMNRTAPVRMPWGPFPDVLLHSSESAVKNHPCYRDAKSGNPEAAFALVQDAISAVALEALKALIAAREPVLVSAHAFEAMGVNAIPEALADEVGGRLGLSVDGSVVQINVVSHTGADGFSRLARQAAFDGEILPGTDYVLVDDFVGQGGTLANLRGFVESKGGRVIAATALTGKSFSARLMPSEAQLSALRMKHGSELENWWCEHFGHRFDCLTQSEARYLERTADADTIRNRIAQAEQAGDCGPV